MKAMFKTLLNVTVALLFFPAMNAVNAQDSHTAGRISAQERAKIIAGKLTLETDLSDYHATDINKPSIKSTSMADTAWTRTFYGNEKDEFYAIQQTTDGGYILAGKTNSAGAGDFDGWLVKTNANGVVLWNKTFGDSYIDELYNVRQTADGGYIACGMSTQFGWAGEGWLLKTDASGNIVWNYGFHPENGSAQSAWDYLYDVIETDEGYIAVGYAPLAENMIQGWILKVDHQGIALMENTFGGEYWDRIFSVQALPDHQYIACGDQHATYNDSVYKHDGWLIKFDSSCDTLWTRHYGAQDHDIFRSVKPIPGGGFIIAGERQVTEATGYQGWVVKTDPNGNSEWNNVYGSGAYYGVQAINNNQYLVAGTKINNQTMYDGWLNRLNSNGISAWQYTLAGTSLDDMFLCLSKTADGGFITGGKYNSQMTSGEGWLVKILPDGPIPLLYFVQNFDTVTPPALPTNWSAKLDILLSNTVAEVKTMEQGSTTSAPNAVFIMNGLDGSNGQPDTAAFVTLITPYVTVGNTGARLIFYGNGGNNLLVGTMSDPNDPATFNLVEEIPLSYNFTVDTVVFNTPGNTYIALKHKNTSPCNPLFIDDVTYEQIINVGIEEHPKTTFTAFPNPASTCIEINATFYVEEAALIDLTGRITLNINDINNIHFNLNTAGIIPGTYVLRLNNQNITCNQLVIITR